MTVSLAVGGVEVATYVTDPDLDIRLAPRPYLHPVRTLGGTVVTDELCFDHPWHLGASLTVADVNGVNLWGGRTYVRGRGYLWLPDHGRIRERAPGFLTWEDASGRTLLTERREITAAAAPGGWELSFRYALTAPPSHEVVLGSPATHGRTGGAGYGGFFWRLPGGSAVASSPDGSDPHGSAAPWVAVTVDHRYTLTFRGLEGRDRWFVRTGEYNGVCAALAFDAPLVIAPSTTLARHIRVRIAEPPAATRP
nr:PmoA family protein [uncultured Actinoplanes sp.]